MNGEIKFSYKRQEYITVGVFQYAYISYCLKYL